MIFEETFRICSDIEKMFDQRPNKFFSNITYNFDAKRMYKKVRDSIKRIEDEKYIPSKLFDSYINIIGRARDKFGHCDAISYNNSTKILESIVMKFELNNYLVFVRTTQIINGGFDHILICTFAIMNGTNKLIEFDINYEDLDTDKEDLRSVAESELSTLSNKAKKKFLEIIKDDIINYIKEFIDQSERRVLDGRSRVVGKRAKSK